MGWTIYLEQMWLNSMMSELPSLIFIISVEGISISYTHLYVFFIPWVYCFLILYCISNWKQSQYEKNRKGRTSKEVKNSRNVCLTQCLYSSILSLWGVFISCKWKFVKGTLTGIPNLLINLSWKFPGGQLYLCKVASVPETTLVILASEKQIYCKQNSDNL